MPSAPLSFMRISSASNGNTRYFRGAIAGVLVFASISLVSILSGRTPPIQAVSMLEFPSGSTIESIYSTLYTGALWTTFFVALLSRHFVSLRSPALMTIGMAISFITLPVSYSILTKPRFSDFLFYLPEILTLAALLLLAINLQAGKERPS